MKIYLPAPVILICIITFSACTPSKYVYTPATANLLFLENKNDLKAAVNFVKSGNIIGLSGDIRQSHGIDIQGAYAVNEKAAIKLTAYTKQESNESVFAYQNQPPNKVNYKKQGMEISGGLYNFSGKKAKDRFQLFAGAGGGKFSLNENRFNGNTNDNYYHNMNYFKAFIQPTLSLKSSPNYKVTLATAVSLIKYSGIRTNYKDLADEPLGYIDTKPSIFIDFVLQNEFGFRGLKGIKFQWQAGVTNLLTAFPVPGTMAFYNYKYDYNKVWLAVGVVANFKTLLNY